jgi:hypothetical protein
MDGYTDRALTTQRQPPSNSSHDTDRAVAGLVARLLLHFWTPQELSEGARKAMAEDWVSDLREFGPDAVAEACGCWRRSQTRRPTIADIRKLAIEEHDIHARRLALAAPPERWPAWLADIWGPEPVGPMLREAAIKARSQ